MKNKFIVITLIIICLLFVIGLFIGRKPFFRWYYPIGEVNHTAIAFSSDIMIPFITSHSKFPANESELISEGYLRKETKDTNSIYTFIRNRNTTQETRCEFYYFSYLHINYGIKVDDIEERNCRLYNKNTGQKILLIDGPHKWRLETLYETISLKWYHLLKKS